MARALNRLSARQVATLKEAGRHGDGGGLYLNISSDCTRRRWVFLFRWQGRRLEMGLGSPDTVTLAKAREYATAARLAIQEGRNPLDDRRAARLEQRRAADDQQSRQLRLRTFGEVADDLIASKGPGWRNAKHRAQWAMTLKTYAAPLRTLPVAEITTEDVLAAMQPIWTSKPETASRTRGRIEAVIDAARARGLVPVDAANPARWKGHLSNLLPPRQRLSRGHHAALPWKDLPAFMVELRARIGISARALEWTILTASRLGEALGTRWHEIDKDSGVWAIPGTRMKAKIAHRVPLSPAAVALLKSLPPGKPDDLVFPGFKRGKPLSDMTMKALFKRMGVTGITTHGFRSTFRDWAGEATHHPREICEAALAHAVGDRVELAYRRGDALEKRRALMCDWASFCEGLTQARTKQASMSSEFKRFADMSAVPPGRAS
jgi:integrase